jgi:hypothetical protein
VFVSRCMYVRALQKRQENGNSRDCNLQEAGMKLAPSFSVFPFHIPRIACVQSDQLLYTTKVETSSSRQLKHPVYNPQGSLSSDGCRFKFKEVDHGTMEYRV